MRTKKQRRSCAALLALGCALACVTPAAAEETLTNQGVVEMKQLGFSDELMLEKIRSSREYYVVMREPDYVALKPQLPARHCVIERRPLFDMKLKNVLEREPLPELVLVTNGCS